MFLLFVSNVNFANFIFLTVNMIMTFTRINQTTI